ncbi:MAG TPA: hypothetical protein VI320_31780 [Terracidiphilus sp.]
MTARRDDRSHQVGWSITVLTRTVLTRLALIESWVKTAGLLLGARYLLGSIHRG